MISDYQCDCIHYQVISLLPGIIVYGGVAEGLIVQPRNNVPIDGFPIFTESYVLSQGVASSQPFNPHPGKGNGLVFDTTYAQISYNFFYFASVLNFGLNINIFGTNGMFFGNKLECPHLHTNAFDSTLMDTDISVTTNIFRMDILPMYFIGQEIQHRFKC